MFDWSQFRDLLWEARWDAVVMLGQAILNNIVTYWWFGPLLLVIAITATRRAWLRLLRFIGVPFLRSHGN
jgi:hypothetical protein